MHYKSYEFGYKSYHYSTPKAILSLNVCKVCHLYATQSARLLFFDYSPLGYLNKIFNSPNEILIAQTYCCGNNTYKSYLKCIDLQFF